MKTYLVGGAVRDMVMGIEPKDRDYVVVGSSPEEMIKLGFSQVGASFPVFLHPTTGEEYALARTERKVGVGYNGFEVAFDSTVTLVEDLKRRDLTMNAMAYDFSTGEIIDPFGGRTDIESRVIRHTSEAFADDPVRVLRAARFAARYDFRIADDTVHLMRDVVHELEFVPQERIFAEIEKGLGERHAIWMFESLEDSGAFEVPCMRPYAGYDGFALHETDETTQLVTKFAFITSEFEDEDYEKCCIPTHLARVSKAYHANREKLGGYDGLNAMERIELFERLRAFSDATVLFQVLEAINVAGDECYGIDKVLPDLTKAKSVDAAAIAASVPPKEIRQAIAAARAAAL